MMQRGLCFLLLASMVLHTTAYHRYQKCDSDEACEVERQLLPLPKPVPVKINFANFTLDSGVTNFAMYALPDYPGLGKLPAIVHYTPYSMDMMINFVPIWQRFLGGPFKLNAMVIIQLTGTGNSTGTFNGLNPTATCTLAGNKWIAKQPWSNGVISIQGASAMGIEGYLTHKNPDVGNLYRTRSALLEIGTPDLKNDVYPGGAYRFSMLNDMTVAMNHTGYMKVVESHESHMDPYWEKTTLDIADYKSVNSPTLHYTGWLDVFIDGQMGAIQKFMKYSHPKVRGLHHVIVGPFGHCFGGNVPYNTSATTILQILPYVIEAAQVAIFNQTHSEFAFDAALVVYEALLVKFKIPKYIWYVMGSGVPNNDGLGNFLTSGSKPPPTTKYSLYLDVANHTLSEGRLPYNTSVDYIYDPKNPYPSIGGNNFDPKFFATLPIKPTPPRCGLWDQNLVGERTDVVKMNSSVLKAPVAVFGKNEVTLYVSSNCTDTDFVALLVDVFPNGTRLLIQQSQIRMRWRDLGAHPDPMVPGRIYRVTINLSHIAYIFRAGHQIGLDITSSTWPHVTVNPNTGAPLSAGMAGYKIAENTLYSGGVLDASLDLAVTKLSDIPVWYPDVPKIPHLYREIEEITRNMKAM